MTDEKKYQSYVIPNGEFGPRTFYTRDRKKGELNMTDDPKQPSEEQLQQSLQAAQGEASDLPEEETLATEEVTPVSVSAPTPVVTAVTSKPASTVSVCLLLMWRQL